MIIEYHRPKDVDETLELLKDPKLRTVLMGGGTSIDRASTEPIAVVDLQDAGLDSMLVKGKTLEIGATVTLQNLFESLDIPAELKSAIYRERGLNLRQAATVAGTLVTSNGRSSFTTAMLALDAAVVLEPDKESIPLGDFLPSRERMLNSKLISKIVIPLNVQLAFEYIARTPADLPIVCAAVSRWPSGRTRVTLGGTGEAPILAMDGPENGGEESSAVDAYSHKGDRWASAEYRQEMVQVLVKRSLSRLEN